jgi:hypothetical protein
MREDGYALMEVILLGLLLFVPTIWMLTVAGDLHRAALGSATAAREAGVAAGRSGDVSAAYRAAHAAGLRSLTERGLDPSSSSLTLSVKPVFDRGGLVEVIVSTRVPVFQAPLLGRVAGPSIELRARHLARIDPYRSAGNDK